MALNSLLEQVKNAIFNDDKTEYRQGDKEGLIAQIEGLFAQHQQAQSQPQGMDPYGGLPNEAGDFDSVKPTSQKPDGDPADQH